MEIRPLGPDDFRQAAYLSQQAFGGGSADLSWLNSPNKPDRVQFGVFDEQGLQAKVAVNTYQVYLADRAVVPMGGLAGVASLPASRGKGYAGACIRYTLERMREAGQIVSMLFPFSIAYYQRFGWEWTGFCNTCSVPTRALQVSEETEYVRAAGPEDRPIIDGAYRAYARRLRGMIERTEKLWNRNLNDTDQHFTYTYLYERDGQVEGYLSFRSINREQTYLHDFLPLTRRAYLGLLGLLHRHEMQVDKFAWDVPHGDRLWYLVCPDEIETKISARTMSRLVDAPAALRAWQPDGGASGSVVLRIHDSAAPWNAGTWKVEFEGGQVEVGPTGESAQVEMDIRALSQIYFGAPSTAEVRAVGGMEVYDEAGYAALQALVAGPPMWINDFF
jgi:predicted acetyltransferase